MPTAVTTPVGIVYDADGSVTDALPGQGAGASESCFNNAAYGGVDNFGADAHFLHALVILNGNCALSSSQLPDMEYRLVRVLGRVLGLDWSQLNLNVITGSPRATADDYNGFPVMHASDSINCAPISLCYSDSGVTNPYLPKMDDQARSRGFIQSRHRTRAVSPANNFLRRPRPAFMAACTSRAVQDRPHGACRA